MSAQVMAHNLDVERRFKIAFEQLVDAYLYSQDTQRDVWDFSVEIDQLQAAGLSNNDLRWLVCKGYVEHARETTQTGDKRRVFEASGALTFSEHSCFALTGSGFRANEIDVRLKRSVPSAKLASTSEQNSTKATPRWDRDRHKLHVGNLLVKQFKWRAANQERVLVCFEEQAWSPRIDDPLPPQPLQDPKRRLHDTIKCLNRNQENRLIRFRGDGTGEGVLWELIDYQVTKAS